MNLNEYQQRARTTDLQPDSEDISIPLLGLAGEVGSLVAEYKKRLRDGAAYRDFRDEVHEELGDLLWYAATLASRLNLTLEDVASANLQKTAERWLPRPDAERILFDEDFPDHEQLPRTFLVEFRAEDRGGVPHSVMTLAGGRVGDPLTDNAYEEDGYRFHDAMHLAFAAVLGWSPLFRALLKRKRKSNRLVDVVEDGGRAIAIEEGLVAYAFAEAERHSYFTDVTHIDTEILRTLQRMTARQEVAARSLRDWERALLDGFAAWRQIVASNGGFVEGDLLRGTFRYQTGQ